MDKLITISWRALWAHFSLWVILLEQEVDQNNNKTLKPATKTLQRVAISKNDIVACFAPLVVL